MTALTLQFEDKLFSNLKQFADRRGYSVDNYILYILAGSIESSDRDEGQGNIDALLESMQFQDCDIPVAENGKGTLAQTKYF